MGAVVAEDVEARGAEVQEAEALLAALTTVEDMEEVMQGAM